MGNQVIRLWEPSSRCLGGVCFGFTRAQVLSLGDYFEDDGDDPDGEFLQRFFPAVVVSLSDGIVVSIGASEQCLLEEVELIGSSLDFAASLLGGLAGQTHSGAVEIYETGSGVELYVRDDRVSQVIISDFSLIPED